MTYMPVLFFAIVLSKSQGNGLIEQFEMHKE